jgi:DNA helicase-2/ATP-dependent DNA helicase PcrA
MPVDAAKALSPAFVPDEVQRAILEAKDSRALIIAGPGTGKTAVLSERIKRLIGEGVKPASILALSFTVRAAAELRDRVRTGNGAAERAGAPDGVFAATFHSFAAYVLRNEADKAGLPGEFSVMGEDERDALLREICGASGSGAKKTSAGKLGVYIESRKRYLLLPGEKKPPFDTAGFLESLAGKSGPADPDPAMEALYAGYRKQLRASGRLDYDDLIVGLVRLFLGHPGILASCRKKFPFIFVDEYQDLNFAQYVLIRLLAPGRDAEDSAGSSLWVIGDPDQAIYGFRGSDKRFIDRFLEDYPDAARFELTRSFRCALPIIRAAAALTGREMAGSGRTVELFRTACATDSAEAEGIARRVAGLIGGASFFAIDSKAAGTGDAAPEDCAVLFRAGIMAAPFVKALENHGIPYELKEEAGRGEAIPFALPQAKGVSLMTMHASKGLEFDYVFVPGLEEGIVPFTLYDAPEAEADTPGRIEEEKRLLYVAMTRARKGLYLSWAGTRNFRGRILKGRASRFLEDLEELVPIVRTGPAKKRNPQIELF